MQNPNEKYFGPRGPDERRLQEGEKRTFEVQQMWEVHHEIVRRLVLGQKATHIAKDLGVSVQMVSYVRNSPVVRDKIEIMKGARDADTIDLAKRIRENAAPALRLLEDIIEGEVDGQNVPLGMRAKEANTMLARGGYGPISNVRGQFSHAHYSSEEIDEIKQRAREAGLKSGVVVDAEIEEVKDEKTASSNSDGSDADSELPVVRSGQQ